MNVIKQDHHTHVEEQKFIAEKYRVPYWKRAHYDWRFWTAVILMLAAMVFYVMTDNFGLLYRSSTGAPVSTVPAK